MVCAKIPPPPDYFHPTEVAFPRHVCSLTRSRCYRLANRAWQTLRKPVPELINILGVDVPDAPDVSLAGIRADAATLNWTRPRPNRPVRKFLIQVNGVNGELEIFVE